jgi:hypothetical protein
MKEREREGEEKEEDWRRDTNFVKERPETRRNRRTGEEEEDRKGPETIMLEALSSKALEIRVLPRSRL